jgi:hypothetical protein
VCVKKHKSQMCALIQLVKKNQRMLLFWVLPFVLSSGRESTSLDSLVDASNSSLFPLLLLQQMTFFAVFGSMRNKMPNRQGNLLWYRRRRRPRVPTECQIFRPGKPSRANHCLLEFPRWMIFIKTNHFSGIKLGLQSRCVKYGPDYNRTQLLG